MKTQRKTTARWAFELACYLVMLIQGVQLAGYQYSLIYITEEFHLTDTAIGLLSCMQFLPTLVVPLLCGGLLDRFEKKKIAAVCVGLFAVGCGLIAVSGNVLLLAGGIGLLVCGTAMLPALMTTLLAETDPARSNYYASMTEVFYSIGTVASPLVLSLLIRRGMPWCGLYLALAVGAVGLIAAFLRMRPAIRVELREAPGETPEKFRLGALALLFIAFGMLYTMTEVGFTTFLSTYFARLSDETGASLSISIVGLTMVLSRMAAGRIRRHKERIAAMCAAGAACAALAMALFPARGVALVWCVLFGLIAGPCWPMMMSLAIDSFPGSAGRMTTLILAGAGLGGLAVNLGMGFFSDACGVAASYLFPAGSALLCAAVMAGIARCRKKDGAGV